MNTPDAHHDDTSERREAGENGPASTPSADELTPAEADAARRWGLPRRGRLLGDLMAGVRNFGRDLVSVALGRLLEPPAQPPATTAQAAAEQPEDTGTAARRVGRLHEVAEKLRGAADSYIAAKLDELDARVDTKLDHIERRIDSKIAELHEQLRAARDRELRHRLRLLKLTLIFTVLVALLSLGYKWIGTYWLR